MSNTKRVIYNTGFLYGKMIISMFVALYSTRLILNALGAEDYGIFNLVAGVIAMLSFLNAAMTTSTQRYLSYYFGAKQTEKLKAIFNASVTLHLVIGLGVALLLEIAGLFLFNGFLNIPAERIPSAKIIYHFMVVSMFFTINAVPYDAAINAHEDLFFDAITGILESLLKLGIAIFLLYTASDKLILYGLLIASTTIFIRIIKSVFCLKRYPESKVRSLFKVEISLFREMLSFAGWNLFGALCGMGRSQGLAIILNLFFGPIVNAAYGIATQINGQLMNFSGNMLKALNPQIMKSEGSGERKHMLKLAMRASKYAFLLLSFFAIPLLFEMDYVLKLWLKNVPGYTIIFCRLALLASLANLLTIGLQTAIQATGKIKIYQSVVGGLLLLNLPIAWLLLRFGFPAYSVLASAILIELLACCIRLYLLHQIAGLSVMAYLRNVIFRIFGVVCFSLIPCFLILTNMTASFLRLVIIALSSSVVLVIGIYMLGLERDEQMLVTSIIEKQKQRFLKLKPIHE